MTELDRWHQMESEYGWSMPSAPWWKRLPIIRHVRALMARIAVERWYATGLGSIGIRSGYDDWVIFGMWHGHERTRSAKSRSAS